MKKVVKSTLFGLLVLVLASTAFAKDIQLFVYNCRDHQIKLRNSRADYPIKRGLKYKDNVWYTIIPGGIRNIPAGASQEFGVDVENNRDGIYRDGHFIFNIEDDSQTYRDDFSIGWTSNLESGKSTLFQWIDADHPDWTTFLRNTDGIGGQTTKSGPYYIYGIAGINPAYSGHSFYFYDLRYSTSKLTAAGNASLNVHLSVYNRTQNI